MNEHSVSWTSPSNIALVKYWGKHGVQLPCNPSISFTLSHSVTTMKMSVRPGDGNLDFFFEGNKNTKFADKIKKFLASVGHEFPWLLKSSLVIESSNTFPHSSGIASSASSMSALCLCLLSLDEEINNKKHQRFYEMASRLARLASGSASRSVYPFMASWGQMDELPGSSDEFASQFNEMHPVFFNYCDSILIVEEKEKSVSSRAGHGLMMNHPFKEQRFVRAHQNMQELIVALKAGDLSTFIRIVEEEALMLHALMMTSSPSYLLLKPNSLELIEKIRAFREEFKIPACFTIDAGPNIDLLYPKEHAAVVRRFIEQELQSFLTGQKWIHDETGTGPARR